MKIVVAGAGVMVGKAFAEHFSAEYQVLALMRRDLDVTDERQARRIVSAERPALVVNCEARL